MVDINCGECNTDCIHYGRCKPNKHRYRSKKDDPKKYCKIAENINGEYTTCGLKLKRQKTEKFSNEYREITLECPKHGVVGAIEEQFKKKGGVAHDKALAG